VHRHALLRRGTTAARTTVSSTSAEAYEFWGVDWLTYDPYARGWHSFIHQTDQPGVSYYVRYPNGDGYLAYPGAPIGHADR